MANPVQFGKFWVILLFAASIDVPPAQAQHFRTLYLFNGLDGQGPTGTLVRDLAGNLYGTTFFGGAFNGGVVFKMDGAGNETVLYNFSGPDGLEPVGLVRDVAGNLYGTTQLGGVLGHGTVFELDSTGIETVLYSFSGGADGSEPGAAPILDSAGNLYGTTQRGGDLSLTDCFNVGCGVVFELDTTSHETVLHTFEGGSDGIEPTASLIRDGAGNLYGTTIAGGSGPCAEVGTFPGCGIIFKVSPAVHERVLYTFTGGPDGSGPNQVIRDSAGKLYGTAVTGGNLSCSIAGSMGCGVVFELSLAGQQTVLHPFAGGSDGAFPAAGLVRDSAGNLYGTTSLGGTSAARQCVGVGCGIVFKLDASGTETILHSFHFSDGDSPQVGLVRDQRGNLYGTTAFGGSTDCNCGVVFKSSQ
jgi:uncharacterized repeat protein (TIGR03803 family)